MIKKTTKKIRKMTRKTIRKMIRKTKKKEEKKEEKKDDKPKKPEILPVLGGEMTPPHKSFMESYGIMCPMEAPGDICFGWADSNGMQMVQSAVVEDPDSLAMDGGPLVFNAMVDDGTVQNYSLTQSTITISQTWTDGRTSLYKGNGSNGIYWGYWYFDDPENPVDYASLDVTNWSLDPNNIFVWTVTVSAEKLGGAISLSQA